MGVDLCFDPAAGFHIQRGSRTMTVLALIRALEMPSQADDFFLAPPEVQRAFDAVSEQYRDHSAVQREIRERLIERLDLVRLQPARVIDLGAGDGEGARRLQKRYSSAAVAAVDFAPRMTRASVRHRRILRGHRTVAARAEHLPFVADSVDLVFSNLLLEWCPDPDAVMAEVSRVLRPGGLFSFTTLGPDTLVELRRAWRAVDEATHVHRFIDMHDLGDALIRAGFAEPVMDVERLTISYRELAMLWRDLRGSGATNLASGRRRTLTGRGRWRAFEQALSDARRGDGWEITVEVVYGHAWGAARRERRTTEFAIDIAQIGRAHR